MRFSILMSVSLAFSEICGMAGWCGPRMLMCDVVYGAIGLAHIEEAANGGEALHFDF